MWSTWNVCSESCGTLGQTFRTFVVNQGSLNGGVDCVWTNDESDKRSCNTDVDCPVDCVGKWSAWSVSCSESCGGGNHSRTWAISTVAENGGQSCDFVNGEVDDSLACNTENCPVDCEGHWNAWSDCSASCGLDGTQVRSYSVTVDAVDGGSPCGGVNSPLSDTSTETRECLPTRRQPHR